MSMFIGNSSTFFSSRSLGGLSKDITIAQGEKSSERAGTGAGAITSTGSGVDSDAIAVAVASSSYYQYTPEGFSQYKAPSLKDKYEELLAKSQEREWVLISFLEVFPEALKFLLEGNLQTEKKTALLDKLSEKCLNAFKDKLKNPLNPVAAELLQKAFERRNMGKQNNVLEDYKKLFKMAPF